MEETRVVMPTPMAMRQAGEKIRQGQVIAMPTETVYGLAANAFDPEAVARIFEAKGRPQDNPLIVHIADMEMLPEVVASVPEEARILAEAFWPGPLTMILPRGPRLADAVCAGLETVGVRMPDHPLARDLIRAAGVPLAAPSANLSGSPSPTTVNHVLRDLRGRIPLVFDGGSCRVGVESTVLALDAQPVVLRPGFVTVAQIEEVLGRKVAVARAVTEEMDFDVPAPSPGMKYKHYAPNAKVILVKGSAEDYVAYVKAHVEPGVWALCHDEQVEALHPGVQAVTYGSEGDDASQAAELFSALRRLDDVGAEVVYARSPSETDLGLAVYNRLLRAAAFHIVEV